MFIVSDPMDLFRINILVLRGFCVHHFKLIFTISTYALYSSTYYIMWFQMC